MILSCSFGKDSWESLGLQGDQTSQSQRKSVFTGRTDAEAEDPIFWPPDVKNWLLGKDRDAGRDWKQEEKGIIEYEMGAWHHQFNGHEFERALGVDVGQGSLVCCSPWGCKEVDTTEKLNWLVTDKDFKLYPYISRRGFPGGSVVKNLPAMQEMQIWSSVLEDPVE